MVPSGRGKVGLSTVQNGENRNDTPLSSTRRTPDTRRSISLALDYVSHLFLLLRSRAEVSKVHRLHRLRDFSRDPVSPLLFVRQRSFSIVSTSLEVQSSDQQLRKVAVVRNYSDGSVFVYAIKVNRSLCRKIMGHRIWSSGWNVIRRGLREHPHNYVQSLISVNLNPNGRMHLSFCNFRNDSFMQKENNEKFSVDIFI